MERLSKLVCENLIACPEHDSGSRLWEGLWERIMMEDWEDVRSVQQVFFGREINIKLIIDQSCFLKKKNTFAHQFDKIF